MNARNTLPAVGTTVYAIVKNNSSFKLEVVEGTLEAINEENFKVARNHTDCIERLHLSHVRMASGVLSDKGRGGRGPCASARPAERRGQPP